MIYNKIPFYTLNKDVVIELLNSNFFYFLKESSGLNAYHNLQYPHFIIKNFVDTISTPDTELLASDTTEATYTTKNVNGVLTAVYTRKSNANTYLKQLDYHQGYYNDSSTTVVLYYSLDKTTYYIFVVPPEATIYRTEKRDSIDVAPFYILSSSTTYAFDPYFYGTNLKFSMLSASTNKALFLKGVSGGGNFSYKSNESSDAKSILWDLNSSRMIWTKRNSNYNNILKIKIYDNTTIDNCYIGDNKWLNVNENYTLSYFFVNDLTNITTIKPIILDIKDITLTNENRNIDKEAISIVTRKVNNVTTTILKIYLILDFSFYTETEINELKQHILMRIY